MSISEEDVVDVDATDDVRQTHPIFHTWLFENFLRIRNFLSGGVGVTDTFTTMDGKTITVTNGIITDIT